MKEAPSLVLSGYYGYGNTGDEAVLEAILADLRRECPDVRMTVLSASPEATAARYGVRSVHRFSPADVWRALRQADLLVSGGGSLLQDVTSTRSLWYYLGVIAMARAAGAKVMVYANGLGPLRRPVNRVLTATVLRGVQRISVRDPDSLAVLGGLGVKRPDAVVTADPAFGLEALPEDDRGRLLDEIGLNPAAGPVFGLALRPWPGWDDMIASAVSAVGRQAREAGGQVLLLPMQYAHDAPVAASLDGLGEGVVVTDAGAGRELNARELLTMVGCCDVLVGMRLHALVFAAAAGVPFVGLAYDPKVSAFVSYLAGGGTAAGSIRGTPGPAVASSPGEVSGAVGDVWNRRAPIGRFLRLRAAELRLRSRQDARMARELLEGVRR